MAFQTDKAWQQWGENDPYFGVVSFPEFHTGAIEANIDEFFETGRREIAATLSSIERFYGARANDRALDFGSGVGRLVLPLAKTYRKVVGVDISPAMIAEAALNCSKARIVNAEFAQSDDALSRVNGCFDLVHSYIVLQHIPIARGMSLTHRLLDRVAPGGVAVLHYSVKRTLSPSKTVAYVLKHNVPLGRNLMNLLQHREWDAPAMQMNNYSLPAIIRAFEDHGLTDIVVMPEWHSSAWTARVYGRKP